MKNEKSTTSIITVFVVCLAFIVEGIYIFADNNKSLYLLSIAIIVFLTPVLLYSMLLLSSKIRSYKIQRRRLNISK